MLSILIYKLGKKKLQDCKTAYNTKTKIDFYWVNKTKINTKIEPGWPKSRQSWQYQDQDCHGLESWFCFVYHYSQLNNLKMFNGHKRIMIYNPEFNLTLFWPHCRLMNYNDATTYPLLNYIQKSFYFINLVWHYVFM